MPPIARAKLVVCLMCILLLLLHSFDTTILLESHLLKTIKLGVANSQVQVKIEEK